MAVFNKIISGSEALFTKFNPALGASRGISSTKVTTKAIGDRYLHKRLSGPPTVSVGNGDKAFLHGTTVNRFPYGPGSVFKVNQSKFYFADVKDAAAYALGANTSCLRSKENIDPSEPLIISAIPSEKETMSEEKIQFNTIGSGWWSIESGVALRVAASWKKNEETGLMEPYQHEKWDSFYRKDFEVLTEKINNSIKR